MEMINEYLKVLNEEQMLPVLDTEGAVLVLAGAGSGKTRVLTSRISHIVKDKGVSPYSILAITFTNKAANEMKERISAITSCDGMWICTIHSMCTRILRANIDKLGFTNSFTIFSENDKQKTIKKLCQALEIEDEAILKQMPQKISYAKNKNLTPSEFKQQYKEIEDNIDIFSKVYEAYQAELKRQNALDFDDLLVYTYLLFRDNKDVLEKYQEKFKYIHVDEFQDTNKIQYLIIEALSRKYGNIFAVGDDDQSIYGWRGANISNILNFKDNFADAKIYKLQRNYRSTKKILDAANLIIKNNTSRMEKELWTENPDGVRIETYAAYDEKQEAYYIANQIRSLIQYSGYKYSDFGILMRVNALSRVFEQEFVKYNIPFKLFGGQKFYERKEIMDILGYLRILINEFDDEAIKRVINVPKRGIGASSIETLETFVVENKISLYNAIMNISSFDSLTNVVKLKIEKFKNVLLILKENIDKIPLSEFVEQTIKVTGISDMYADDSEESINRRMNIADFVLSAKDFQKENPNSTVIDFMQSVTLSTDMENDNMSDDSAVLATVHSVKGLEFKVVFVIGMDDKVFPLGRAKAKLSEMEEERRLMYVAITRAKERLYLTRANSRYIYGRRENLARSPFLVELGDVLEKKVTSFVKENKDQPQNAPKINMEDDRCKEGALVRHLKFGEGTITAVSGTGENSMITVSFPGLGVKTLVLRLAPIEFV